MWKLKYHGDFEIGRLAALTNFGAMNARQRFFCLEIVFSFLFLTFFVWPVFVSDLSFFFFPTSCATKCLSIVPFVCVRVCVMVRNQFFVQLCVCVRVCERASRCATNFLCNCAAPTTI